MPEITNSLITNFFYHLFFSIFFIYLYIWLNFKEIATFFLLGSFF